MAKHRTTIRDTFYTYPFRTMESDQVLKGGDGYVHKSSMIDDHECSSTYKEYMDIATKLFEYRFEMILDGQEVKLPLRSGLLQLYKYKPNKKSCDFGATNEYRRKNPGSKAIIYHKNYHTQGYKPILKWVKKNCAMTNKHIFMFSLVRDKDRKLAALFKENPNKISNLNTV